MSRRKVLTFFSGRDWTDGGHPIDHQCHEGAHNALADSRSGNTGAGQSRLQQHGQHYGCHQHTHAAKLTLGQRIPQRRRCCSRSPLADRLERPDRPKIAEMGGGSASCNGTAWRRWWRPWRLTRTRSASRSRPIPPSNAANRGTGSSGQVRSGIALTEPRRQRLCSSLGLSVLSPCPSPEACSRPASWVCVVCYPRLRVLGLRSCVHWTAILGFE